MDCSINSALGKKCEVECVVSNTLMSRKKANVEVNERLNETLVSLALLQQ